MAQADTPEPETQEFSGTSEYTEALAEQFQSDGFSTNLAIGEAIAGTASGNSFRSDLGVEPERDVSPVNHDLIFRDGFD